jgi:hypothetical protein
MPIQLTHEKLPFIDNVEIHHRAALRSRMQLRIEVEKFESMRWVNAKVEAGYGTASCASIN